ENYDVVSVVLDSKNRVGVRATRGIDRKYNRESRVVVVGVSGPDVDAFLELREYAVSGCGWDGTELFEVLNGVHLLRCLFESRSALALREGVEVHVVGGVPEKFPRRL